MIFAILDFVNYKNKTKNYSFDAIKKEGGIELNDLNFDKIFPLKPGTIFIHPPNSFLSWLIMYYTSCIWSHVMTTFDYDNVVDVTLKGVIIHPFRDYFDKGFYSLIFHFNLPNEKKTFETQKKFAMEHV
jgi:hypothetical protein